MQQAVFGKKGGGSDDLAAKRAAFQAAERQRHMAQTQVQAQPRSNFAQSAPTMGDGGYSPSRITPEQARAALGMAQAPERKSLTVAYLLWLFFSTLGAHRFYLGAIQSAFMQAGFYYGGFLLIVIGGMSKSFGSLFYLGAFFVLIGAFWMLLDLFLIPGLRDRMAHRNNQKNYNGVFA